MLELDRVRKHFVDGDGDVIRAVDDVSLKVSPGELLALYGPSGSGKSTLLLLMGGLLRPDAGHVLFDGQDLAQLTEREAAAYRLREIGFVWQSFGLLPTLSALDNAAIKLMRTAPPRVARGRAMELLDRVGLGKRAKQPAAKLSAGERQRVAIARALSTGPQLVLADEPTGNLDTRRGGEILAVLSELCREQQTSVVLVTHDPQATAVANRVMALHDGHLHDEPAVPLV